MKQEQVEQALKNAVAVQYQDKLWKFRLHDGELQLREYVYCNGPGIYSEDDAINFNRLKKNDEGYLHLDGWEIKPLVIGSGRNIFAEIGEEVIGKDIAPVTLTQLGMRAIKNSFGSINEKPQYDQDARANNP